MDNKNLKYAELIDHTFLKPDATKGQIKNLIDEAKIYHFKTVCVNGTWAKSVKESLRGSGVGLTVVIGFPLGASTNNTKVLEAQEALQNGADEIDMVINISALKDANYEFVLKEIKAIKYLMPNKVLKVIIETALLTPEEIKIATKLVIQAKADFVKTSTGFNGRGASLDDIKLIKSITKGKIGIKASGGIKTLEVLKKMIKLGATRIGTSSGVDLMQGSKIKTDY